MDVLPLQMFHLTTHGISVKRYMDFVTLIEYVLGCNEYTEYVNQDSRAPGKS